MLRFVLTIALVASATAQGNNGDLDSVLAEIFGKPDPNAGPLPTATTSAPKLTTIVPTVNNNNKADDTSCRTDDGKVGECVRYFLCNTKNNTVITDGTDIIDIRVRDGPCASYLDACCLLQNTVDPGVTIAPPIPTEQRKGCGWRNPTGVSFQITGNTNGEAEFAEFPWMVAILQIEPVNDNEPDGQKLNVYVGGGSLIEPNVVLTSAHYVYKAKNLRVRAGEWDTQTMKEMYPYQDRDVTAIEVHKDFNKGNLFYDVALLFLSKPMDMAPNVALACLPPPRTVPASGTRCFASGWGKDKFGKEGRYQVILKKVEVPVVEKKTCQTALRNTRLGKFFELHSSFMCAGGEPGKDTCKGDGGSPLVCPIEGQKDRYMQSGIVAWGIGCGEDGTPGVYVNVEQVRSWIDDKVAGRGYDKTAYNFNMW